jgi:hypothetical protein
MVSGVSNWGCGDDRGCSLMIVDGIVSGSGSSWMWIMGLALTTAWVRGSVDAIG